MRENKPNELEKAAAAESRGGYLREMWAFFRDNKKWWLLPILVVLVLFGLLILLSGTSLAPFIYTIF